MTVNMKTSVYLDYNATAPVRPEVIAAMQDVLAMPLNTSSVHSFGRLAKQKLETARTSIAEHISAFPNEIIFTGSATEANNWVLQNHPNHRILISAIEHASIYKSVPHVEKIPVDSHGVVKLDALAAMLAASDQPTFVSVMLANNETGVIQPVQDAAHIARKYKALIHTDAVQALGKIPVDFNLLDVDFMTLASHKCGGPVGVGILVAKNTVPLTPFMHGGGQELNRRAGTSNLAAIAGFAAAIEKMADLTHIHTIEHWRDAMEEQIMQAAPQAVIIGKSALRLPNTSCIAMPGVTSETQSMAFDIAGFAVSAGSACSSGRMEPSHVLAAMHAPHAESAIRVSLGWNTQEQDVKDFTAAWIGYYARKGKQKAA